MQHGRDEEIEREEVLDFIRREIERLKKACDHYRWDALNANLEMASMEAQRLLSNDLASELKSH